MAQRTPEVVDFIDKLVAVRKRGGLTQGEVALRMGLSKSAVCNLETRRTSGMTLRNALRYADAVGADLQVQWLGEWDDEEEEF